MTSAEAKLVDRMCDSFTSTPVANGYIDWNVAGYFFGNNPYQRTGREKLMVCRMALSELDNDLLATFIGAVSLKDGGSRGSFLGYKAAFEGVQASIDAALEGERKYCKIIITLEAHSVLYHEREDADDY